MSNQKIFLCFFLLLSISVFCDDTLKKINNANLLFPYLYENTDDRKIEYKLTAFNGCYEWFSTNNNYISAQDIPDENQSICSSNVIVSLVSNKYFSNTIWIIAKDKGFFLFIIYFLLIFY